VSHPKKAPARPPRLTDLNEPRAFVALCNLRNVEGPVSMTMFTSRSELTPYGARIALGALVRLGFATVERGRPQGKIRPMKIRLTEKGKSLAKELGELEALLKDPRAP
jgi:hypothetical protein